MFPLLLTVALAQQAPTPPTPPLPAEAPEAPAAPEAPTPPAAPEAPAPPAPPTAPAPPAPRFEADGELAIKGLINDVFGMGGKVTVADPVADNAFLMGGEIRIDEPVHGDLFASGGDIEIDSVVHGDVYAFGGEVSVSTNGRIDGHLIAYGGEVDVAGPVAGSISAGAGQFWLDAPVGGNLSLEAGEFRLGEHGAVAGDLVYSTPQATDGVDDATAGQVTWEEKVPETQGHTDKPEPAPEPGPGILSAAFWWSVWTGWEYFAKLVVGGALLALFGTLLGRTGRLLVEKPSESLGWGLVTSIALPLLSTMALLMILPFPLGIVGYTLWAVGLYLAQLVAAQAIGDLILKRFRPEAWGSPFLSMAVGLVPLVLVMSIPWLGVVAWYLATVLGFGAAWLRIRELAEA